MFFVLFPAHLLALPFSLRRRLKITSPAWKFCSDILLRYACLAKIGIQEDHRSPEFKVVPPFGIYIANHQSYIDIPLLMTIFQVPPIMKKEVLYIPIFGWMGWISGALPVSRSNNHSRKKVFSETRRRILDQKLGIQVYPEGTRSKSSFPKEHHEVKRTLLVFAFNEKIPVIPASIYGSRGVLSKFGFVNPRRHVGIIVHKEMDPKDFATPEEFGHACWEKVREGHQRIRNQLAPLNGN